MMSLKQYIENKLHSKKILLMTHTIVGYPSLDENMQTTFLDNQITTVIAAVKSLPCHCNSDFLIVLSNM